MQLRPLQIDITTTATLRPEILDRTYTSFKENLFHDWAGYRLLLNVDPIGSDCLQQDVVAVARKHFESVTARCPTRPNFGAATRWLWKEVESDYFFNLEDDWELLRLVDLLDMVRLMEAHPRLAILRLSMFPSRREKKTGVHTCRQWNRHVPWNDEAGFYEIPEERKGALGYSGNPSLIRKAFILPLIDWLREDFCPEKITKLHCKWMSRYMRSWRYGVYHEKESPPSIKDIGREWRQEKRWYKHPGYGFYCWEPLPEGFTNKTYFQHKRQVAREKGEWHE